MAYTSFRKDWKNDPWSFSGEEVEGHYFCVGDQISNETIHYGPYAEAVEKCEKILTPEICTVGNSTIEIHRIASDHGAAWPYRRGHNLKSNFH